MARLHQRKPTFFWQATLILLPVIVLAVMGWYSLRQDKILAEHDAKERAQTIADDLLSKIWSELMANPPNESTPAFEVDDSGNLVFPPPYQAVPTPEPFDLTQLDSEQVKLWQQLQSANLEHDDLTALAGAYGNFVESHPPERFAAMANYGLGLLLAWQGNHAGAAQFFHTFVEQYSNVVGESGLPLQPLARWKLLFLSRHTTNSVPFGNAVSFESFCSNVVFHPSPLTPELLRTPEIQPIKTNYSGSHDWYEKDWSASLKWQQVWGEHELARQLFFLAQPNLHPRAIGVTLLEPSNRLERSQFPSGFDKRFSDAIFWINFPSGSAPNTAEEFLHEHSGVKVLISEPEYRWLAVRHDETGTNHWFVCRSQSALSARINALLEAEKQLPEYFGVGVQLAEEKITPDPHVWHYHYYVAKGAGQAKKEKLDQSAQTVLASAIKSENGFGLLKINVHLTSPEALYKRQQARVFWFGSLVVISTVAALAGLAAAWNAFRRQLQLSEMKSNFVSSVSHELRAPIASVRLMAENLERQKVLEPQKQKEYFAFIVQECRRLTSLIENVLDFSRIEQGRKQYDFEPTDMIALATQTVKLMEPYAAEKGVKLETFNTQHSTFNAELNVDGRAIQQALVNLIDNAIKHSSKGETVTVGLDLGKSRAGVPPAQRALQREQSNAPEAQPGAGETPALLWVQDHGSGIPLEEQQKIFERFYRRGSELRRETQGVGIGLSIVKHIVEAHDGRVRVESEWGKGSRFTIELPVKQ